MNSAKHLRSIIMAFCLMAMAATSRAEKFDVWVITDPPGAVIEVNGIYKGRSPILLSGKGSYTEFFGFVVNPLHIRATPSDMEKAGLGAKLESKVVKKTSGTRKSEKRPEIFVSEVAPSSPAEQMGLQMKDQVLAINGVSVPETTNTVTMASFFDLISKPGFGGEVTIRVRRGNSEEELRGKTWERPRGTYYVQEKCLRTKPEKGEFVRFDMKLQGLQKIILGEPEPLGSGTGFIVAPGGYVLTCWHVVKGAGNIEVRTSATTRRAKTVASDPANDLCLLQVEGFSAPAIPLAPEGSVRVGAVVFPLGYPLQQALQKVEPVAGSGVVAALTGFEGDARRLQHTAPQNPGNSGGPLLDEYGCWIGVTASHMGEGESRPQGVNFAIKTSLARSMLESVSGIKLAVGEQKQKLSLTELSKRLSGSVVLIEVKR
jgi:S1-C subfamily serine protease